MSKPFDGLDIESMFAEAVEASENTGEKDPTSYGKNAKKEDVKEIDKEKKKIESAKSPEKSIQNKKENKVIEQPIAKQPEREIKSEIKRPEMKKEIESQNTLSQKPLVKINAESLDVLSITRIIEMKEILDNYNERERAFIQGYFQQDKDSVAEIIYSALTAEQRGLDALNKIVVAREHSSAERAFYLMELDNNSIEAIHEQINLLTGELDNIDGITDINKIKVCRTLEGAISKMDNNVFLYINKLQEFASKALI